MSDFEIEISGGPSGYRITVRSAAGGATADAVGFPIDDAALQRELSDLQLALLQSAVRTRRLLSDLERPVQELGQKLFDFVLPSPDMRALFVAARQAATASDPLTIRLRIGPPNLMALPWEILFDAAQDDYLSLTTPIVRSLDVLQRVRPLAVAPPLQILAMAAEPIGLPHLDVQREKELLSEALGPLQEIGRVQVTWVQGQTWRALQATLDRGDWHVLHFVGHGSYDRRSGEGVIALADGDGELDELSASDLARILAEKPSLRLVVLNSCDGARGSSTDPFSSTASVLLRRGIPAVVAMQFEISDDAAKEFARGFYDALVSQHPIEKAVTRARTAVKRASRISLEWLTPVLFLRDAAGSLFDIADVQAAPSTTMPSPTPLDTTAADPPSRRRATWLVSAVVSVAAIAAIIVAVPTLGDGSGTSASVTPTALPPTTPAVPSPRALLLADDFSGPSLDPTKWGTPQHPDNMTQRDGHLELSVRPDREVDFDRLDARLPAGSFTEATFTVTVRPSGQGGDGGASVVINSSGPRPQRLLMGPAPGGAFFDPLTCDKPQCRMGVYEDFTQPAKQTPVQPFDEAVPVRILLQDGQLVYLVKGVEYGRTKVAPGDLETFSFAISSGGTDSWDVRIDDLVIR